MEVNENASKSATTIALKDITVGDGGNSGATKVNGTSKNVNIKNAVSGGNTTTPDTDNNTTNSGSNNSNTGSGSSSNKNTTSSGSKTNKVNTSTSTTGRLPKAGRTGLILVVFIVVLVGLATFFYVKMKIVNKKTDE